MSDYIIITGDQAIFMPAFGAAMVVVQPGKITGSGKANVTGQVVCIEGDESSVSVPGCSYISGSYSIPGTGTLKIDSLSGDQVATKTKSNDTAVILKGSLFNAVFEVASPAQMPTSNGPVPDPMSRYTGNGQFVNSNMTVTGT